MDDELDIQPWPVLELIGRAVTLATVARRGMIELDDEADVFSKETDRFELSTWARTELTHWMTARELAILNASIGDLSDEQIDYCDEALYAAGAVAWSIRAVPAESLPVGDSQDFNASVLEWSPGPWDKVRQLQKRARVWSDEHLAEERERAELWYWRSTSEIAPAELAEVVAEVSEAGIIPIASGDFATDTGQPFAALSEDEQAEIAFVSQSRLRALNWVCGFGESWDTAPLELE